MSEADRRRLGTRLTALTLRIDDGRGSDEERAEAASIASVLGRDPAIEEAKEVLVHRLGVTPAQAFELLRAASAKQRRKVRAVARDVVAGAVPDSWKGRPP